MFNSLNKETKVKLIGFTIFIYAVLFIFTWLYYEGMIDTLVIVTLLVSGSFIYLGILLNLTLRDDNTKSRLEEMKERLLENSDEKISVMLNPELIETPHAPNPEIMPQTQDLPGPDIKEAILRQKSQNNILELMLDNMTEIREYFSISKRQAQLSFWLAVVNCLVGIVLLSLSVYFAMSGKGIEPAVLAAITGAISELFAATSLMVHNKSLSQLNHYYDALHENEMFLSTVNLIGNLSVDKQDDMYIEIIRNELTIRSNSAKKKAEQIDR